MKLIDEEGNVYESLRQAAAQLGVTHPVISRMLSQLGHYHNRSTGKVLRPLNLEELNDEDIRRRADAQKDVVIKSDPLMEKLRQRYSESELRQIADGKGLEKYRIDYPEIHLHGEHHRVLVMSDTHIGSIYSPEEWHGIVSHLADEEDVECILHCGDLVDGLKIGRAGTQIYELSDIGYDAQLEKAVRVFSQYNKPVYIISGNHDMYYSEFTGANIVKAFADRLPNVTYLGHNQADMEIGGAVIRLFHGNDGSSYALSYRLQKLVEAINGGHKPNIMLCGHVHKFCYILERNIHAISVPCMQAQTDYMRGKKLAAHTGVLILDFDTVGGNISNLSVNYFPFYA